MAFDLNQKVALITGGASGIGLAFAKTLLQNGVKGVTLADINPKSGEKAIEDIEKEFGNNKAIFVETDVRDLKQYENAFEKTVEKFKNVDILFNNSGIANDSTWQNEIAINVNGFVHGMLLGLENYLQKYRQGEEAVIVNTGSVAGLAIFGNLPIYSATKAAIIAMTRCWGDQQHYDRTKVRCIVVCPGGTKTPLYYAVRGKSLGEPYEKFVHDPDFFWPAQSAEFVAEETIKLVESGERGVWVIEGDEPAYEYIFADRRKYTPENK